MISSENINRGYFSWNARVNKKILISKKTKTIVPTNNEVFKRQRCIMIVQVKTNEDKNTVVQKLTWR